MSKSSAKRIEYLEEIIIGTGFLLKKLQARYGDDFGTGIDEQVRACIKDCDEVGLVNLRRKNQQIRGVL
ncbi:hypothetical protein [Paraburkholderia sediminicola]|uniref:hypothetical protein n=1 Tax=Paraburkholderia sediminicola TaxID=458836 RepID=UPI0038B9373F